MESFIDGREFALEGILTNGELRMLALFDKPDPLDGPFFEETIYVTPSREDPSTQAAIVRTTQTAMNALGLTRAPSTPKCASMIVEYGCSKWPRGPSADSARGFCPGWRS